MALGPRVREALQAADDLAARGLSATVIDARFAKPLDTDLMRRVALEHEVMVSIEEGSPGGFAAHLMNFLAIEGLLDRGLKFRPLTMPDVFMDQDKPESQYEAAGLNARHIVGVVLNALGRHAEAVGPARRA